MQIRGEGAPLPLGWSVTDCDPPGRVHLHYRGEIEGRTFSIHLAFKKADSADPMKWLTEEHEVWPKDWDKNGLKSKYLE